MKKLQHGVGGKRQKTDNRFHAKSNGRYRAAGNLGHFVRLLHCNTFWHKLSEYQCKVRQNNGNHNYRNRIKRAHRQILKTKTVINPVCQAVWEVLRSKRAAQESGQRDAYLYRRKKSGRFFRHPQQPSCRLISCLLQSPELRRIKRYHGNLRRRKKSV